MASWLFLIFAVASSVSMNCPIRASFCVCMTVYTGHIPERGRNLGGVYIWNFHKHCQIAFPRGCLFILSLVPVFLCSYQIVGKLLISKKCYLVRIFSPWVNDFLFWFFIMETLTLKELARNQVLNAWVHCLNIHMLFVFRSCAYVRSLRFSCQVPLLVSEDFFFSILPPVYLSNTLL